MPGENTERSLQDDTFKVAEGAVLVAKTLTARALTRVWRIRAPNRTWGNHRPKKVFWRLARVSILSIGSTSNHIWNKRSHARALADRSTPRTAYEWAMRVGYAGSTRPAFRHTIRSPKLKHFIAAGLTGICAVSSAWAQSSVTLYGSLMRAWPTSA